MFKVGGMGATTRKKLLSGVGGGRATILHIFSEKKLGSRKGQPLRPPTPLATTLYFFQNCHNIILLNFMWYDLTSVCLHFYFMHGIPDSRAGIHVFSAIVYKSKTWYWTRNLRLEHRKNRWFYLLATAPTHNFVQMRYTYIVWELFTPHYISQ